MSFAGNGTYLPAPSDFVFNLVWADSDGDGVADNNDNFPGDANRALVTILMEMVLMTNLILMTMTDHLEI